MDDPLDALFLTPEEALVLEMKQWPQSKRDALKSMLDRREAALNAQVATLTAQLEHYKAHGSSTNSATDKDFQIRTLYNKVDMLVAERGAARVEFELLTAQLAEMTAERDEEWKLVNEYRNAVGDLEDEIRALTAERDAARQASIHLIEKMRDFIRRDCPMPGSRAYMLMEELNAALQARKDAK